MVVFLSGLRVEEVGYMMPEMGSRWYFLVGGLVYLRDLEERKHMLCSGCWMEVGEL